MNGPRQICNVALAVFMGVGKSSVGRLVAAELQFEFEYRVNQKMQ